MGDTNSKSITADATANALHAAAKGAAKTASTRSVKSEIVPVSFRRANMSESFGFGLGSTESGTKIITKCNLGGVADGLLEVNDIVTKVNGAVTKGMSHDDVIAVLKEGLATTLEIERTTHAHFDFGESGSGAGSPDISFEDDVDDASPAAAATSSVRRRLVDEATDALAESADETTKTNKDAAAAAADNVVLAQTLAPTHQHVGTVSSRASSAAEPTARNAILPARVVVAGVSMSAETFEAFLSAMHVTDAIYFKANPIAFHSGYSQLL